MKTLLGDAGYRSSSEADREGRRTSSPPQFGHWPRSLDSAHVPQKVHSKLQIYAAVEPGGRSTSQHSQLGLSSSITFQCGQTTVLGRQGAARPARRLLIEPLGASCASCKRCDDARRPLHRIVRSCRRMRRATSSRARGLRSATRRSVLATICPSTWAGLTYFGYIVRTDSWTAHCHGGGFRLA